MPDLKQAVPPGTYAGNYTDERGNILHDKHPWPSPPNHSNPAALLEALETEILREFVNRFPHVEYVDPVTALRMLLGVKR